MSDAGVRGVQFDRTDDCGCPAVHERGFSRVQRPERSYEITKAVEPEDKPTKGLDLVISGQLSPLADGRVIHCAASDGPPACVIAAKFDRVAIENPANDAVLGEWSQW